MPICYANFQSNRTPQRREERNEIEGTSVSQTHEFIFLVTIT